MTTSSSTSSDRRGGRVALLSSLAVCSVLALALGACSDDGGNGGPDTCEDEAAPTSTTLPDQILKQANMLVEERTQYTADGTKTQATIVNLNLSDFSFVEVDSRFPLPCCGAMACFQLTGKGNSSCRQKAGGPCGSDTCTSDESCVNDVCEPCKPKPLLADKATLSGAGLAGGSVELEDKGSGKFLKAGLPAPLFGSGDVTLSLTGRSEADYFPSSEVTVTAPEPLVLQNPDPSATTSLSNTDLPVRWKAGNGELIELTLKSADPAITDKVVCIARDDGCATVPAGAIEWVKLAMKPGEKFSMSVRRVVSSLKDGGDHATLVKAASRVDFQLEQ